MVVRVLVVVVMTTAVFSSAAISASPLHEIVTTPGPSLVCGNVVVHANAAIAATIHGDDAIARSLAHLRTVDFDTPGVARKQALNDLYSASTEIDQYADRAKSETARLRGFADHPAGDDRKADLDALTIGLEAALDAQRDIARSVDTFVRSVAFRNLSTAAPTETTGAAAGPNRSNNLAPQFGSIPDPATGGSDTYLAREAANRLAAKVAEIETDEARAATHSEPAIGGC